MTPQDLTLPLCRYCGEDCLVAYGMCHCRCGGMSPLAKRTKTSIRHLKGFPTKFISGHNTVQPRPDMRGALPFKIDGIYCRPLPLTQGIWTIVWDVHYEMLMQWNWQACWNPKAQAFYAWRGVIRDGKHYTIAMARVILRLSDDDLRLGDHINGVTLDNRLANLRPVNYNESTINQKTRATNKSGRKGVSWHERNQRWTPNISDRNGNDIYLGEYEDFEVACAVAAEIQYHGEFARAE